MDSNEFAAAELAERVVAEIDSFAARLAAAAITAPRFRGRSEMIKLASRQTGIVAAAALRALEASPRQREIAALRGDLHAEVVRALDLPAVKRQREIREARKAARRGCRSGLAVRTPGGAHDRALRVAFAAALATARFRAATHCHDTGIEIVARGAETASSSTGSMSPRDAGLPNAYANKGFSVTTSEHKFQVSPDFWQVPRDQRATGGVIYLSPTVRVRQGRGTSLVVERLAASASGRIVWSAATARAA